MKKEVVKNEAAYHVSFNYNVVPEHPVESVIVLGDFNEWSLEDGYVLKENKKGDFEGKFKIPAGRDYHFRYLVNGNRWANEKDADRFESSPLHHHIDNSVLSLPAIGGTSKSIVAKDVKPATDGKKEVKAKAPAKKAVKKDDSKEKQTAVKKTVVKKEATPSVKKSAPTSKPAKKDDLTKIEGIGPKIAELLVASGIDTFATLGASKKSSLTSILDAAGSRYAVHDPSSWAQQAKLANTGKWDQLATLQAQLKGGKKK